MFIWTEIDMRVSMFFDLSDLYHRVNKTFGRKLSYEKTIWKTLEALSKPDCGAIQGELHAYGIQKQHEASGFISCLRRLGFKTHFKRPTVLRFGEHEYKLANWGIGLTLNVVATEQHTNDAIVIATNNPDYGLLGEYLEAQGRLHYFLTLDSRLTPQITITEEFLECPT